MPSNINPPSSLPPLDSNLTMVFKGFIVTLSPLVGWVALKLILFVFNHPQYFILTWLSALAIGLVAEFFKEARRPAVRLSRLRPNLNRQSSRENSTESTSNTKREPIGAKANPKNDSNSPTTVLYKSTTRPDSENNVPDEVDDDAEESDPTTVQVETRVKMSKRSRSRSSSKTSSGKNKGFGKPVVVRMNYQMNPEDSSSQKAQANMNNIGEPSQKQNTPNRNTAQLEYMARPTPKVQVSTNIPSSIKPDNTTKNSQKSPVTLARLEQSIARSLADDSNGNNNSNRSMQSQITSKENSRYLFGKLDKTNDGDSIEVELALEADEISDDDVQRD